MSTNSQGFRAKYLNMRRSKRRADLRCAALADENERLRQALRHYMNAYGSCPCGAWFGPGPWDTAAHRPHVIGCPVALATEAVA